MSNLDGRVPRRVLAYVDGFNLYYGLLRDRPELKWLNLQEMVRMLFPHEIVVRVKYFTAGVNDRHPSPSARMDRQDNYLSALEHSGVEIIKGRLEERRKECWSQTARSTDRGISRCRSKK